MSVIEIPTRASLSGILFDDLVRLRRLESLPVIYTQEIKVFPDDGNGSTVSTGDGKFRFAIAEDLDGMRLLSADIFITTVSSSGVVQVQISNKTDAVDMLTTKAEIQAGDFDSYSAGGARGVPNPNTDDVATGDRIWIDVDAAGTGAKGLGVILRYTTTPS